LSHPGGGAIVVRSYTRRMTAREFDPSRLDVAAFAKEGARLEGRWPLRQLDRLVESEVPGAQADGALDVSWQAHGELRRVGGQGQPWLHLKASARMALECQRCLGPVLVPLEVSRSFLFVPGEDAAAQLDADSEDDVLALTHALDLRQLVEDELLLALPLVPRHDQCPQPLPTPSIPDEADGRPNPFAALAALKRGRPAS
jgi:uncharacterized protein